MTQIRSIFAGLFFVTVGSTAFAQGGKTVGTIPVKDAAAADAMSRATNLSYTFAELGYTQLKNDDTDVKADGFGASGSFALADLTGLPLYATAGYSMLETEKISGRSTEVTDFYVGAGYRLGLSDALDLTAELDVVQAEAEPKGGPGTKVDDTGFRLDVGARFLIATQFEIGGGVTYEDIGDDSETIIGVNGLYHIVHGFSAVANVFTSSDATGFGVAGRYNFKF
jgi:hypothetical protein